MTKLNQIRLSDTQLIVLSEAAQRQDGALTSPARLNGMAASKLAGRLLQHRLAREVRTKPEMPVWRRDEIGRSFGLVITAAGRAAIHTDVDEQEGTAAASIETSESDVGIEPAAEPAAPQNSDPASGVAAEAPRAGSKLEQVIDLLVRQDGASMDELIAATGWLPHSTRAALTSLRKRGYTVERSRLPDGCSVYRISSATQQLQPKAA